MSSLNQVQLIGRLGKDPEVKYMPNGDAVVALTVATSETWKDKTTGEKKEATEWHRVVMFGKVAEVVGKYLKKGSLAFFRGKNKTRKWTDKDGVERYTTEVVCDEMKMLGGKSEGGESAAPAPRPSAAPAARAPAAKGGGVDDDSDIPF